MKHDGTSALRLRISRGALASLGLAVALLLSCVQPAAAANADAPVIVLHVETPSFELDAAGLRVAGYAVNAQYGAPALPVWSTAVELPPNGGYTVSYRSSGSRLLPTPVDIPAVPTPDRLAVSSPASQTLDGLPAEALTIDRPDAAIYTANAFYPASPVISGPEQWQQGRRLLAVRVFPFQYNPATRTLRYHPDVRIEITITSGASAYTPPASAPANPPASTPGALRIRTGERGLTRLTYGDLLTAGVPLASVDPASFAMSHLGQPAAIEVLGEDDGSFDPGDLVLFYAQPYEGRYQRDNVYWLTYGAAPGLRMATRDVTPTGNEPVITTITQTLHVEFDRLYQSIFPLAQDADHWFDNPLSPDIANTATITRTYDLALDDALTTGTVRIRAALHGGVDRPADPDKSIAVYLNSHWVASEQWEGMTYHLTDDSAPSTWLDGSPNRVHLVASVAQLPGVGFYSVSPDWVEVTYPALADAEGDRIIVDGVAPGANQVRVSGFSIPDVRVYDLRNPNQPVRLLATAAEPAGSSYAVSFWDADLSGPTYALSSLPALLAPLAVEADAPSAWGTPDHAADYIAIVHPSLWSAIDPLLAHRAAEGLRVAKVDVQDIYDEWSYGRRDPEAIRSFLSYAYHCWNGADCDPAPGVPPAPPQYALLVGDGHYDFTGVSGTSLPNLIPPYLAYVDPWLGETAADNRFASVDGPDDRLPDLALGRIPARTPADVTAVVDKIIAYETAAPAGDWQRLAVFAADTDQDGAGNFHALSDDVRLGWLPPAYDSQTVYYRRDYFSSTAMQAALKSAFDADALYLQWFGHSGQFRWGGSIAALNILHPPGFAANDAWPFTATYSCYTGYFINLFSGYQSLGEVLLLTPQRGSVADLSPSGLHVGPELLTFNRGVAQAMFQQRMERVGQATDAARGYFYTTSGGAYDLIDTMVLFGDPALRLRLPAPLLAPSSLDASREWAPPGQPITVTAMLSSTAAVSTTAQLTLTLPAGLDEPGALSATSSTASYDPVRREITWTGVVRAGVPEAVTFRSALLPGAACSATVVTGQARDGLAALTSLAATVQAATPDADCDGAVDIVDIQQVTPRWGAAQGNPLYHARYDLDGDDQIGLLDVVIAAAAW